MKSRVSQFSRGKLEAGRNELGVCTARDESKVVAVCFQGLAMRSRRELDGVLYADHVSFHSCHPYI